jgi:hypothetical protein
MWRSLLRRKSFSIDNKLEACLLTIQGVFFFPSRNAIAEIVPFLMF